MHSSWNCIAYRDHWGRMKTFETTDQILARRCRYAQYRNEKTMLTIEGASIMGLVRSVREVAASPARWVVTVVTKDKVAA